MRHRILLGGCLIGIALAVALPRAADALQYAPGPNDRINNFFDPPNAGTGTPYASTSQGVVYNSSTGEVTVSGTVSTLNYHTTDNPTLNIAQPFAPALTFDLELELVSITLTPSQSDPVNLVDVLFDYRTTDDGLWDLVVTDPDGGQVVLRADLNAGGTVDVGVTNFEAPTGLRAIAANVDPNAPNPLQVLNAHGVFDIDQTSLYAPLFQDSDNMLGFEIGTVNQFNAGNPSTTNDWVDIFNALDCSGAPVCDTSTLIAHSANAQGSVFGIASGDFVPVPEPGTLPLVGAGLIVLGRRRPRERGKKT